MKVYKIPISLTREDLLKMKGSEGSLLNPIEDANGDLVITVEEFESKEFAEQFNGVQKFELIEYEPRLTEDYIISFEDLKQKKKDGIYDKNTFDQKVEELKTRILNQKRSEEQNPEDKKI